MQWGAKWTTSAMGTSCRLLNITCTADIVYLNILGIISHHKLNLFERGSNEYFITCILWLG